MLFKFHCADPKSGQESVYLFNNITNEVFDEEGESVEWRQFPIAGNLYVDPDKRQFKEYKNAYSPDNPIVGKNRVVKHFRLQMGMACNYNCAYCCQKAYKSELTKLPSKEELDALFERMDQLGITVAPKGKIEYWGGEPLVYWKLLQHLIPKLRKKYGDKVEHSIITNGSLLTDEMVDFFVQNRVNVTISHDGPGFNLRDKADPLDDPEKKAVWLRLYEESKKEDNPRFSFNIVVTPQNCDLQATRKWFDDHFAPGCPVNIESIVTYSGVEMPGCNFDLNSAREFDMQIFREVVGKDAGKWPCLTIDASDWCKMLVNKIPATSFDGRCDELRKGALSIDLKGNVVSCHNFPTSLYTIGTIEDLDAVKNDKMTHWSLRPLCKNCPALSLCRGGCPHMSERDFVKACTHENLYHTSIMTAAWSVLTGLVLKRIEPMVS